MNETFFKEFPIPAVISDRSGVITASNDSFCRFTGTSPDEICGMTLASITDETGACYLTSAVQADGAVHPAEIYVVSSMLKKRALTAVYPHKDGFMISFTDTTYSTGAAKAAHQLMKLTEAGGNLTDIAHQWKQPLNSLSLLCADFADDVRIGMATAETADRFSGEFMDLINYMASTVMDFLEFMTPESEKTVFDARDCMPLISSLMEPQFKKFGIHFKAVCKCCENTCDISRANSERCVTRKMLMRGSRGTLQQALINLVGNAAEAVKNKPERNITLELSEDNGTIRITVSDSGGGIPKEYLKRIFSSGFSTKMNGSSGLGLYITKNIVTNLYKGSITADNVENGAEFTLSFSSYSGL